MSYLTLNNVSIDFPVLDSKARSFRSGFVQKVIGGRLSSSKRSVSVRALDSVTLSLQEGDRLGLIGHNGAGKTTLLRTLAGVYPPSTGTINRVGQIAPLFDISLVYHMLAT